MVSPAVNDDTFLQRYEAYLEHGSYTKAGKALGVGANTIRRAVVWAERKGLTDRTARPAPEGRVIKEHTDQYKNGVLSAQSIKYVDEPGPEFELAPGHKLKAQSVLTDGAGNTKLVWNKAVEADKDPENVAEIIAKAFENFKPFAPAVIRPKNHDEDSLAVLIACDWHLGARIPDHQADWSLPAAKSTLIDGYCELIDRQPMSHTGILLSLGDITEADNEKGLTPEHGHVLNPAAELDDTTAVGCEIFETITEYARQKFKQFEIVFLPGNHDPITTISFRTAFNMFYRNTQYVDVWGGKTDRYYKPFGCNIIGGTHGHKEALKDLPMIMAHECKSVWSNASTMDFHSGHRHGDRVFDGFGVRCCTHGPAVPSGKYSGGKGLHSRRILRAFEYHKSRGSRGNNEVVL